MTGIISVNIKKIKANTSVNRLLNENYRDEKTAEKYDDGHRVIRTDETKENVFLLERPENYDRARKDRVQRINEKKEAMAKLKISGDVKTKKNSALTRRLRSDTVDTLGLVIQPSADFINGLTREDQIRFFRDSLEVLQAHPEEFGRVETAVIHFDENTPHMQCLASTLNEDTLTSDCQRILGNKSKMSEKQTILASDMQKRGWKVERGMKRIDNPEYRNWKDNMEAQGFKVNRFNDRILQEQMYGIKEQSLQNTIDQANILTDRLDLDEREAACKAREAACKARESILANERREFNLERQKWAQGAPKRQKLQKELANGRKALDDEMNRRREEFKNEMDRKREEFEKETSSERQVIADEKRKLDEEKKKLEKAKRDLQADRDGLSKERQGLNAEKQELEKSRLEWAKGARERYQERVLLKTERHKLSEDRKEFESSKKEAMDILKKTAKSAEEKTERTLREQKDFLKGVQELNSYKETAAYISIHGMPFAR